MHKTQLIHELKLQPSPAYPGIEYRLRGWESWKRHMLRINERCIVGFHDSKPRFVLLTNDPAVMALDDDSKIDLVIEASKRPVPRESPRAYIKGVIRYLRWWWKHG